MAALARLSAANGPLVAIAAATIVAAPPIHAETLTFEADGGVKIVRAYDQYGMAVIEFIGAAGALYQCVVLNAAGDPIATVSAVADMGQMMVEGLRADAIASVACRKVM